MGLMGGRLVEEMVWEWRSVIDDGDDPLCFIDRQPGRTARNSVQPL
jgi:hypothetical protein